MTFDPLDDAFEPLPEPADDGPEIEVIRREKMFAAEETLDATRN